MVVMSDCNRKLINFYYSKCIHNFKFNFCISVENFIVNYINSSEYLKNSVICSFTSTFTINIY